MRRFIALVLILFSTSILMAQKANKSPFEQKEIEHFFGNAPNPCWVTRYINGDTIRGYRNVQGNFVITFPHVTVIRQKGKIRFIYLAKTN
jgi:hypothetical protein